jgi:hypothetical protein
MVFLLLHWMLLHAAVACRRYHLPLLLADPLAAAAVAVYPAPPLLQTRYLQPLL